MGMTNNKYIDLASSLPRVANNEMLYKKLVAKFEASVDIAAFNSAVSAQDFIKAGEIVHAAKGVAGNLSLTAFYESGAALMDQFREGNAPAQENIDEFTRLYHETIQAINEYLSE